tara:strand:+ start:143 stop:376 length:234 start_codon:yes stop_codon:yes gene_type:complete
MTPQQFKDAKKELQLTNLQLSEILGLCLRQIVNYSQGKTPITKTVKMILEYLQTGKIDILIDCEKPTNLQKEKERNI